MPPVAPIHKPLDQVMEYVNAVAKYKWHIAVATLAMTLALTILIAKLPNVYEATTTILVDPQQIPDKIVTALGNSDPYARLNTITTQVLSRSRLEQIIADQQLYPELRSSMTSEEMVEKMRDDITIQVKQGSGQELSTFTITYQGKNPEVVAQVANELATSFIAWNVNSRVELVNGTKEFLNSELQEAKRSLEQQENKLRDFKMGHLGETPDQTVNNLQAISGLRSSLQANVDAMNRLEQDKILLTRLPDQVQTGSSSAPPSLSERGNLQLQKRQLEASIQQLKEHYSDKYPDVVRAQHRLEEVNAQLKALPPDPPVDATSDVKNGEESASAVRLELNEKEMKRLKVEQAHIQTQIAAYQAKVDAAPLREQQLVELSRNYDISKAHYQTLLDKSFNIDMAADLEQKQKGERFTVLDSAQVPEKPVKPHRKMLIPMGGMFAFGLSILAVLAKQTINPAIKTEAELKSMLPAGVKVIGLIPSIETVADTQWRRRWAVMASVACALLFLALVEVLWKIRPML
jgi:succinoglycan biosynthesis transport protein ExoP